MNNFRTILSTEHLIPFNGRSLSITDNEGDLRVERVVYSRGEYKTYLLVFDRPRMYRYCCEPLVSESLDGLDETLVEVLDSEWHELGKIDRAQLGQGHAKHFKIYISDCGLLEVLSHSVDARIL